jgi:hypothetical protein
MTTPLATTLRAIAALIGSLALVCAVAAFVLGVVGGALWLGVSGVVLLVVAIAERGRYPAVRSEDERPTRDGLGQLQRTDEVFDDPVTGLRTRVWYDPQTGQRTYEPER